MEQVCKKLSDQKVMATHQLTCQVLPSGQKSPDFRFEVLCKECRKLGMDEFNKERSESCSHSHSWDLSKCAAVLESSSAKWIPVKPLPRKLPKDASRLAMCRHMVKQGSCALKDECQFAHSELEKRVWTWQMTSQPKGLNCARCKSDINIHLIIYR